jgi:hypothetical protein
VAETILPAITRMTSGRCSPEPPSSVYDRSNAFGPIIISQRSFARDPIIDHPPVSGAIGKHVLERRNDFAAHDGVAGVIHLHYHCHIAVGSG